MACAGCAYAPDDVLVTAQAMYSSATPHSADSSAASSMLQQLQMSGSHLPLLHSIMQKELQSLTPTAPQLRLAQCVQQQRSAVLMQPIMQQLKGQQKRIEVVPLLGMSLMHMLNPGSSPSSLQEMPSANTLQPADLFDAMLRHSPFLNALQSELTSLRKVSGSCYTQIKQHLASVGQFLPPAADDSGRRSSTGSNNVTGAARATPVDGNNSASTSYYGRGLDLQRLQQQADAGALDLIHLEDCISSSLTNLAKLAQQYDIMITAALTAAAEHADAAAAECAQQQGGAAAGAAARAASRKGSFLRPLFDAMRGRQAGSKGATGAGQQAGAIEYVFMRPGVCSHSNQALTHSFTAGVPPDVYSTCIHKLLSHNDCPERVLWMLSVIYARLRFAADEAASAAVASGAHGQAGGVKQWRAPDKFTRKTTKYWVHPSNILRLKLALTKQLPLLVYGADDPVSSGDIASVAAQEHGTTVCLLEQQQQHKVTSLVSSVYFDSPDLGVYHTRLARLDGAKLVRVRYYGQRLTGDAGDELDVFVEQKTHRDKDVGETSFKERASLKQSQLPAFLSGQVPLEQLLGPGSKKIELMGQIQDFMMDTRQAPVMRTEYLRSAWQAYDDNAVRFSFDEHMLLLREGAAARNGSGWCSPLESLPQLPTSDAVRFPYAILEVKLQDREASPAWVHELKTSGVLVEVPKFSKFLHGMALLNPDKIREVPSWFVWRETAQVTLPASLDEMWDMTAERRAQQEMDWQERLDAHDPAALGATNTPEVAAMLMLLKAPRVYADTSAMVHGALPDLADADAGSKPPLVAAPSYDLTATAAAAQVMQPEAAKPAVSGQVPAAGAVDPGSVQLPGLHSYPCHAVTSNLATSSSNSANSSNSSHARTLQSPAHGIMQDGQFGCAGDVKSSIGSRGGGAAGYQGPGGCMQPQLGLMVLPGCKDSFSYRRVPGTGLADIVDSPTADCPEGVKGGSPPFAAHSLSVRLTMPAHRSLSNSSMGSSDLHATNSSSSMGAAAAYAGLPHFTTCSSSPSCSSRSPTNPSPHNTLDHADSAAGYPKVNLANEEAHARRRSQQGTAMAAGTGRPHSRDSSSGGTCDSWKLSTVHPMSVPGPLACSSTTAAPAGPADAGMSGDTTYRAADSKLKASLLVPEGSQRRKAGYRGSPLGPLRGDDILLDFGRLAAQAAAPIAALSAAAAAAGRQQVIQVHYTGAVEAVSLPAHASPTPSPHRVRELSQLLPAMPIAGGGAAADAVEASVADQQVVIGVAADSAAKDVRRKGGRGYKQRMQQWKAAVGGRMKGLRGGRKGSGSMAAAFSLTSSSSANEHMLGFSGAGPRQPNYVKPRTDPKTFFANERTFLQWLQISVLVMMTGLGMLTGSSIAISAGGGSAGTCMDSLVCSASRISGAIIAPVSILFMVYALYLYHKRTNQLLTRSTLRYDDARGPWLLTMLLILVTIVVIVLAMEAFKVSLRT